MKRGWRLAVGGWRSGVVPALVLSGCGGGTRKVYVNVDEIVRRESVTPTVSFKLPTPPVPMPSMSFSIPAQPERIVHDSGGPINTSIAQIEKTQNNAIHALDLRLRSLYASEVEHFTNDLTKSLQQGIARRMDATDEGIHQIVLRYGQKRGPLMASLAVIVGWPDPNPSSGGDTSNMNVVQKKFFLKAKELRREIAENDDRFSADIDNYLAQERTITQRGMANLRAAVVTFRDQMNRKADREAEKEVRSTPTELDIRLAGARTTVLPAIPAQSVQIPAGAPMPPAPQVSFNGIGNGPGDRRRLVEQELQTWLALNRMILAKPGRGIPDETAEFKAWRKTLLSDGP